MSNDVITKRDEIVKLFINSTEQIIKSVNALRKKNRPFMNGHRYITDAELSKRLNINRRTLQEYRTQGKIPYHKFGGKVLYKEEDIEKLLQDNNCPTYRL